MYYTVFTVVVVITFAVGVVVVYVFELLAALDFIMIARLPRPIRSERMTKDN